MGFLFSKQQYDPDRDIPDLTGKVALVTGAKFVSITPTLSSIIILTPCVAQALASKFPFSSPNAVPKSISDVDPSPKLAKPSLGYTTLVRS